LQRYFVSIASGSFPFGSIVFLLRNRYSALPHFGQVRKGFCTIRGRSSFSRSGEHIIEAGKEEQAAARC
jgi:hypothetical protein